ncbi:MAG: PspC domain-containing protein [Deltaproteobacteria bacterium]|jgi:phage shock protein C|nr:PspC domain-containing protein [Deltaproteobacteria bacterium]
MSLAKISVRGPFKSDHGLLLGVVSGLAEHFGFSVLGLRVAVVAASIFLAFWPAVLMYLAAAIIMTKKPTGPGLSQRGQELAILGQADPQALVASLSARAERVERLVRRLEDHVTSRRFRKGL